VVSRVGQIFVSLILIFVVLVGAFLSSPPVFAVVALVAVACGAFLLLVERRRGGNAVGGLIGIYSVVAGLILLGGVACVLLSLSSTLSADVAVGLVAGAGVWVLLLWWAQLLSEYRLAAASGVPRGNGVQGEGLAI
jgi:hypothetical protein